MSENSQISHFKISNVILTIDYMNYDINSESFGSRRMNNFVYMDCIKFLKVQH